MLLALLAALALWTALWLDEARESLLQAGRTLLRSTDVQHIRTGAFIIESIGAPEDGALVLEVAEKVMRDARTVAYPTSMCREVPNANAE